MNVDKVKEINKDRENEEIENDSEENEEEDSKGPVMILSIDVGNGKVEQLKLYSFESPKKDIYEFCTLNKLDYDTMDEILKQVEELIKERLNESYEIQNEKEEEEENKKENESEEEEEEDESKDDKKFDNNVVKQNFQIQPKINSVNKNNIRINKNKKVKPQANKLYKNNIKNYGKRNKKMHNYNSVSLFQYEMPENFNITNKRIKNLKNNLSTNTKNSFSSKKINSLSIIKNKNESSTNFIKNSENETKPFHTRNNFNNTNILESDIFKSNDNKFYLSKSNKSSSFFKSKNDSNNNTIKTKKNVNKFLTRSNNNMKNIFNNRALYDKNIQYKEKERKKLEILKNNIQEDEDELLSFKPKINKISNKVYLKRKEKGNEFNNSNIIKNYKNYKEEKRKELYLKYSDTDPNEKNYTFIPQINKDYQFIDKKNDIKNPNKIFNKLYEYNNIYKEKRNFLEKESDNKYSFKPIVNNNSQIKESFNERLIQYEKKSKEHSNKLMNDRDEEIYLLTKPELFNNNHSMSVERLNTKGDPYTILYLYNDLYKENKKELEKKFYKNCLSNPKINKSSNNLINDNKEKSFKKIFFILDGDGDGIIRSTAINKDKLPKNIQVILSPIFKEIKDDNETLNLKEFVSVCNQLYNILPFEKKRIFSNFHKNNKKVDFKIKYTPKYSFKPKINKTSERIANNLNNFSLRDTSNSSKSIFFMNNTLRNKNNYFF